MGAFESGTVPTALLSATKTVSGTFQDTQTVTYTVVITNSGTGAQADNPGDEFTDVLPPRLALVDASATSGTATATVASNTVTWDGAVAANGGTVTITIHAIIIPGQTGDTVSNQGTVSYDSDGNNTNDASVQTDDPAVSGTSDPTSFVVLGPNLDIVKTVTNAAPYHPGDTLDYQITIKNIGTADAVGVTLSDPIPPNATYVARTTMLNGSPVADVAGAMPYAATSGIGDLATSETDTVTFSVTINNPLPSGVNDILNQVTTTATNAPSLHNTLVDSPVTTTFGLALTKSDDGD